MKGENSGLVLRVARATLTLLEADGLLTIGQAARLLRLSNNQVYHWIRTGLPFIPKGGNRRGAAIDAAVLRAWLAETRPMVWVPERNGADLDCEPEEFRRRRAAVYAMLDRWGE